MKEKQGHIFFLTLKKIGVKKKEKTSVSIINFQKKLDKINLLNLIYYNK